jgi:hypothetical protein
MKQNLVDFLLRFAEKTGAIPKSITLAVKMGAAKFLICLQ